MSLVGECYKKGCKFLIKGGIEYARITYELRKLLWN